MQHKTAHVLRSVNEMCEIKKGYLQKKRTEMLLKYSASQVKYYFVRGVVQTIVI